MEHIHTYTNSKNEVVGVTEEHLLKAVELKIQLQELSPSRRVNWTKHKKMMVEEGFDNSDNNESYRCLVKYYQKKIGKLTKYRKESDVHNATDLDTVQKEIGELYQQKEETHQKVLELNRLKRELSKYGIVTEQIRDAFLDYFHIEIPKFMYQPKLLKSDKVGILIITDFHIGATVKNVAGNNYNYEIAKKRIDELIRQTIHYCSIYEITELRVVCLGDICEQLFMRNVNQAFECEFNFSEQIVKATELLIHLYTSLAQFFNVTVAGISGNHDRMNGQKADNILEDTVMNVVNYIIQLFISLSKIPRLTYDCTDESHLSYHLEINNSLLKFVHGDNDSKKDKNKLQRYSQADKKHYKALIMGHYHHYEVIERDYGGMEIYVGSLMGRNSYNKKLKSNTDASQCLLVVDEQGEVQPIRLSVQHIQR
jgi:UDP-2,3-diacylglucosamine pyrophosphatase LpxH